MKRTERKKISKFLLGVCLLIPLGAVPDKTRAKEIIVVGEPQIRMYVTSFEAQKTELTEKQRKEYRMEISMQDGDYVWSSRRNHRLIHTTSDNYHFFIDASGYGYIKIRTDKNPKEYMEHMNNLMETITYWGTIRKFSLVGASDSVAEAIFVKGKNGKLIITPSFMLHLKAEENSQSIASDELKFSSAGRMFINLQSKVIKYFSVKPLNGQFSIEHASFTISNIIKKSEFHYSFEGFDELTDWKMDGYIKFNSETDKRPDFKITTRTEDENITAIYTPAISTEAMNIFSRFSDIFFGYY
jgi:hypothetical protein